MQNLDNMSKDERSLLLYFESCLVNQRGRLESCRMNAENFEIAERWNAAGFIHFGRKPGTLVRLFWVRFSEEAWGLAHVERRRKAERNLSTGEKTKGKRVTKKKADANRL